MGENQISRKEFVTKSLTGIAGIGFFSKKYSGGKYSPSSDIEPSYKESVLWVLKHKFISSAAIAVANFEQVDEHTSWLNN
ncbi:MAG TPA: hypothetical protein VMV77_21865 [Bacteroidales bacterium]|nr:hypothetical protein [Bacteroidales bacterium]